MKRILMHNLGLKIISVVIAFFVWLVVVYVSDPQVTGRQEITLEVLNEDVLAKAGLAYEIEGKRSSVSITYQIHTQDRVNVAASDFRAYIDLEDYYPATGTVPVSVEVLNNKSYLLESVTVRPAVVRIKTEQIQKKDFDLQIHQSGEILEGYEIERISLDHDVVTVEGPESAVGRISSVGIEVPINGLSMDVSGVAAPLFYDANGNQLSLDERVKVNVPEIEYSINIMKVKRLSLEFEVGGRVADGCRYMGLEASASEVSVMGEDGILSLINSIRIPADVLNLDGASEDKVFVLDVEDFLPDKENMQIPWNSQVEVILKVRQLSQNVIEIPVNRIIRKGEMDEYYYDYDKNQIELMLEGLSEELAVLDASSFILEVDVSGMEAGSHRGDLIVAGLREGVSLTGYSDFQILITPKNTALSGSESSMGEMTSADVGTEEAASSEDMQESASEVNAPVEEGPGISSEESEETKETEETVIILD